MIVFILEAHLIKLHLFYPLPESYNCVFPGGTFNKITFILPSARVL